MNKMVYYFNMNLVPIKELKLDLSSYADRASKGEIIGITKYNRPYFYLYPAQDTGVSVGKWHGKKDMQPATKATAGNTALKFLLEDRQDRF